MEIPIMIRKTTRKHSLDHPLHTTFMSLRRPDHSPLTNHYYEPPISFEGKKNPQH